VTVADSAPTRTPGTPASERELRTQGKRTMAKLLDAGLEVLTARGYHAARVDDVVRVADMSHGTFYLYFANKEDLFRALANECAEEMKALGATLGPVTPDRAGEEELRRWLHQFVETYRRYGAVVRAWMEDQVVDDELVRVGLSAFEAITTSLHSRLVDADPTHIGSVDTATTALLAMVERLAYFTSSRDLGFDDDAVVETLTTLLHRGVFGAPVLATQPTTRRPAATSKRS
jgi:AcrR family transcriptional regulator